MIFGETQTTSNRGETTASLRTDFWVSKIEKLRRGGLLAPAPLPAFPNDATRAPEIKTRPWATPFTRTSISNYQQALRNQHERHSETKKTRGYDV